MSYIIVGGFGFIGKHLIDLIEVSSLNFTVLTRKDPDVSWAHHPYVLDNTLDDAALSKLALTHTTVIYLASSSIPATGSFVREIRENVEPTIDLIDKLSNYNPNLKVIYLSSGGQIYGNGYHEAVSESSPCLPVSPYGYGKLMIENSLAYLHRTKGTRIAILRVANPVGRWQTGLRQGIVNVVFQSLVNNMPVNVFGSGNEMRDYIDADELASLVVLVSNSDFQFSTWNIGSNRATSTIDLITMIEKIVGKKADKHFLNKRDVDPEYAVLDCKKVFTDLKWRATASLESILEKTLACKLAERDSND